jgi:hypothetical protein
MSDSHAAFCLRRASHAVKKEDVYSVGPQRNLCLVITLIDEHSRTWARLSGKANVTDCQKSDTTHWTQTSIQHVGSNDVEAMGNAYR